jgi:hypothetical protein
MRREPEELKARAQALEIERYWRDHGFLVRAWAERVEVYPKGRGGGYVTFWVIRSDLVNGTPTRKIAE